MRRPATAAAHAPRPRPADLALVAVPFVVSGVIHLVRPQVFEPIVPRVLPAHRALVLASGVAELACAAGLAHPRTRRVAARASAGLLVAVFGANVQMALDAWRRPGAPAVLRWGTVARLPVQVPLVRAAQRVARASGR